MLTSQSSRTKNSLLFSFLNILANNFSPLNVGAKSKKVVFLSTPTYPILCVPCQMSKQGETGIFSNEVAPC
jgi:hypothetical protein